MKILWFNSLAVLCAASLLPVLCASAEAQRPVPGPPLGEAHPPLHVHRNSATAPPGYKPSLMRHAYGFDLLPGAYADQGTGQTIAIVDAYGSPTIQSDLDKFCTQFMIPSTQVQFAYPTGLPKRTDGGWALETSLDVEWAHAIAPGATILLVVAKSAQFSDLLPAVDYAAAHASQVSMSWGASEFSSETSYDSHFIKPGVTFTASSGDSGAGVEWPAASPYVVAVGGTSLSLDSTGNRTSEVAWSGSGGGTSRYEPSMFQSPAWTSTFRGVPDVSYNADPNTGVAVYDSTSYNGARGWFQLGGTSAGAPQWAALIALANAGHTSSLSNTANVLYSLNNSSEHSSYFFDITSGSNGYPANPGYDLVTGVGSPLANNLVPTLGLSLAVH